MIRAVTGFMLGVCLAWPTVVGAATLYVNNSGSPACDNTTAKASNSAASPWCAIGRAAWGSADPASTNAGEAAAAGDTVLVTAGTYTTTSVHTVCDRWGVALNPVNTGSSGNPITFRAVGTVTVLLGSGYRGPTIGAHARDYIVWDGFAINESLAVGQSCPDTGPVVFAGTTGSQGLRLTIVGSYHENTPPDNYNGIRLESSSNVLIQNTSISDITCNYASNCAGIMLFGVQNSIIEHTDITRCYTGIFVKGNEDPVNYPQRNNIFRFNRIHGVTGNGFNLRHAMGSQIYQNIVSDALNGVLFYNEALLSEDDITIQNNVFVSTNQTDDAGILFNGTSNIVNLRIFNNIFYGSWQTGANYGANAVGDSTWEHNVYYGYNNVARTSSTYRTFAYWQGTEGQDSASPAGITSDPLFVDTTDYKLSGSSPARNLGVDILDLDGDSSTVDLVHAGAYLTGNEVIGIMQTVGPATVYGSTRFTGGLRIQ